MTGLLYGIRTSKNSFAGNSLPFSSDIFVVANAKKSFTSFPEVKSPPSPYNTITRTFESSLAETNASLTA